MPKRTGPTPEGLAMKAVLDYLRACHIGKIKRVNVGQARIGDAPRHPWAKDTRRIVRFGEVGASDLQVELALDDPRIPSQFRGRDLYPEVKRADWKPPCVPKFGSARSTIAKYRHHIEQVAFIKRQVERGNLGFIVRSPHELYRYLVTQGFKGLPTPEGGTQEPSKAPARGNETTAHKRTTLPREKGSQL